jgi:NADH-quinone oxidoreductase subunit J
MSDTYFYLFATLTVASALAVVFNKNAVAAALSFLFSLCGVAGLFLQLDAQLLAILLVLVYAGAVVALFLFIIMLLDMQGGERKPFKKLTIFSSTIAGALLLSGVYLLAKRPELAKFRDAGEPSSILLDLKYYGAQLFTTYLLPVQVVGFLLLIAMLGVIVLSKKFEGMEDVK